MSLIELVDNNRTDKNTAHSYLELYNSLLISKKGTAKNVLEVGIDRGGSIKLWHDFFSNATVHGLDVIDISAVWSEIVNNPRIILHTSTDAYNEQYFNNTFLSKGFKFDFMIDDGPHTLESMKTFIRLYSQLLTEDGILIVEDVQNWGWINEMMKSVPDSLLPFVKTYDLRHIKGRWDDIVFTIEKKHGDRSFLSDLRSH